MLKIKKIAAIEILDSRGNPTVRASVELENGIAGAACVPSGASTGEFEALELRDGDNKRYEGKGVLTACENINTRISKALKGQNVFEQKKIDQIMIDLDGTDNKSNLGANAILGVSLAAARAASKAKGESLFEYLYKTFEFEHNYRIPVPMFNVINGGKHADSGLDVQEFMIVPTGINSFAEQLRAGSEIYHNLSSYLKGEGLTISVGDEGGFAPKLKNNEQALEILKKVIKSSGYDKKIKISLDIAASEIYDENSGEYALKSENTDVKLNAEEMVRLYEKWIEKYNILSIEDGLGEKAWEDWEKMTAEVVSNYQNILLVGDDFLATNKKRLKKAVETKSANAILIKLNQIGTLTETISCIKEAQKAGWKVIVSHRSGETGDNFIADLAVAANADYIKAGAPCRGERLAKYNRLIIIEEKLKEKV